jgi:putative inorganic carbon (hco3(-)) transporter
MWLLLIYVSFLGLGTNTPFIAALGYVWVDTLQPQAVAYFVLNQLPVAMIMAIVAFGGYVLLDRCCPPPFGMQTGLQVVMALWVTVTLIWAQVPEAAWVKWDWAFKTILFATFIPYVIRSKVQIEAFIQVYVFSLAANFIPFGIKVLYSGGGYGINLGLQSGNSGLAEGGLLSTSCLMIVPLSTYLAKHSGLIPRVRILLLTYWVIAFLAIVTAIGTYERSAFLGLLVLAAYIWMQAQHKLSIAVVIAFAASIIIYCSSNAWNERISTIGTYQSDSSAYVRILVWKWTLQFATSHPLGGGFVSYLINHVEVPPNGSEAGHIEFARAFHSVYFEVLGEHGYPGIIIFLTLASSTFLMLRRVAKQARPYVELQWLASLSEALQCGLAVFMYCGAFVGIAFQPMFWYFISISICLDAYLRRLDREGKDLQLYQPP